MKQGVIALFVFAAFVTPFATSAMDISRSCGSEECPASGVQVQIDALLKQIAQLQAQLTALIAQKSTTASCFVPTYDLYLGRTDAETNGEVKKLQLWLKADGYFPDAQGTGYYGEKTAAAVVRWQKAHGMDFVTTKSGIGKMTRAKMQEACGNAGGVTQVRSEIDVPNVTYSYGAPGTGFMTSKTEPAFGEGIVVDPQTTSLPANVKEFTKNAYYNHASYVMRMLYVNASAPRAAAFANERGTMYVACTGSSQSVGMHLTYGKTLLWQCNPGTMGMITQDGRDIGTQMWAAN